MPPSTRHREGRPSQASTAALTSASIAAACGLVDLAFVVPLLRVVAPPARVIGAALATSDLAVLSGLSMLAIAPLLAFVRGAAPRGRPPVPTSKVRAASRAVAAWGT